MTATSRKAGAKKRHANDGSKTEGTTLPVGASKGQPMGKRTDQFVVKVPGENDK